MSNKKGSAAELWRKHDIYKHGVSYHGVVTRSQTPFSKIKNTPSDLELFSKNEKHHPENKPHLMVTLKGEYGAIPRAVITRSLAEYLDISEELCKEVDEYKKASPQSETKSVNETLIKPLIASASALIGSVSGLTGRQSESASTESPSKSASKESPSKSASKESPSKSASKESPSKSASKESPSKSASKESPSKSASTESSSKSASTESPSKSASTESQSKSAEEEEEERRNKIGL